MTQDIYNQITTILLLGGVGAMLSAGWFFVSALVGWRSPHRNWRLAAFAVCLVSAPLLVCAQQAILWCVFLPSLGQEIKEQNKQRGLSSSEVQVGDVAPAFKLVDTQEADFDLQAQQGKVVLVNFFATWCGPCRMELPHVQELWNRYGKDERFAMLVIDRDEPLETVLAFRDQHGFGFPIAIDASPSVFSKYAKEGIPRTYLIGPDGRICFIVTGFDPEELKKLESEIATQLEQVGKSSGTK